MSDSSTPGMVDAIKANWADYYAHLGRSPHAELSVGPYLSWLLTGLPDAFLNVVFRTRLPSDRAGGLIAGALDSFRSRNIQQLSWWAETGEQRTELEQHLLTHGLTFEAGGTGMAADLQSLPEDLPRLTGLTIRPVEDQAALKQWCHVSWLGFGLPVDSERRWFELWAASAWDPPMRSYLAEWAGQPVATSQLFASAGVGGIYNVTCLPEARRRGIGGAITMAAMLQARRQGCRLSILQASEQGYPVYRRLGFRDYGKLNQYRWANETAGASREGLDA